MRARGRRCRAAPPRCTSPCSSLGVEPGDDVLVSTLTFAATANAVAYVGARPCSSTASRDAGTSTRRCSPRSSRRRPRRGRLPAAVVAVDLYGQCADYDTIVAAAAPSYGVAADRGRRRGPRRDLRRPPGRVVRRAAASSRSTATRSSPPRGGGHARHRRRGAGRPRAGTSPPRPASRCRTTSTPRSATTTGCRNLLAAFGRASCAALDARIAPPARPFGRYATASATCRASASCPTTPPASRTAGSPASPSTRPTPVTAGEVRVAPRARTTSRPADVEADAPAAGVRATPARASTAPPTASSRTGLCLPSGSHLTDADQDRVIEIIGDVAVGEATSRRRPRPPGRRRAGLAAPSSSSRRSARHRRRRAPHHGLAGAVPAAPHRAPRRRVHDHEVPHHARRADARRTGRRPPHRGRLAAAASEPRRAATARQRRCAAT